MLVKEGLKFDRTQKNPLEKIGIGKKRKNSINPEAYDRMEGNCSIKACENFDKSAEIIIKDLTGDGFETEDARDFLIEKINQILDKI